MREALAEVGESMESVGGLPRRPRPRSASGTRWPEAVWRPLWFLEVERSLLQSAGGHHRTAWPDDKLSETSCPTGLWAGTARGLWVPRLWVSLGSTTAQAAHLSMTPVFSPLLGKVPFPQGGAIGVLHAELHPVLWVFI